MPGWQKGLTSLFRLSPLLVLAGCMVGPDYGRPETKSLPQWQDVGDTRVKAGPAQHRT